MEAAVGEQPTANACDDLEALMNGTDKAEAEGRYPVHLPDGSCRAAPVADSWYEEGTGLIAILEREFAYPVVAVCRHCHEGIRREDLAAEWEHVPSLYKHNPRNAHYLRDGELIVGIA